MTKAKQIILNHAYWRIKEFTEIGGEELEIVESVMEEVADLTAQFVAKKLPLDELKRVTKEAQEKHRDGSDT